MPSDWGRRCAIVQSPRGFTLIEVVIALLLLGLALVLAVPALPPSRNAAERAAHEWAGILGRGRRAAADRGVPVVVLADRAAATYAILIADSSKVLERGPLLWPPVDDAAVDGQTQRSSVYFAPSGRATGQLVWEQGRGPGQLVVSVDDWTGRVRVRKE